MMDSQENTLNKGTEEVKQTEQVENQAESEAPKAEEETPKAEEETPKAEEEAPKADAEAPEAKEEAPTTGDAAPQAENAAPAEDMSKKVYNSKKEVIERLKEIVASDETPDKAEVDHLKTTFYKLHFAEREQQQKAYLEAGGDPEKYQVVPDEDEEVFKAEMNVIKEKRQKAFLALRASFSETLQLWSFLLQPFRK